MGSHSSSSITDYVNNNLDIQNSVQSSIEIQSNSQTTNYQINSNTIDVGDPDLCCAGFTGDQADLCLKGFNFPPSEGYTAQLNCGKGGLQITQSGSLAIKISKEVTTQSNTDLVNSVSAQVQTQVQDFVNQNNNSGILSGMFGESNSSDVAIKITNSFKSDLSVSLAQNIQSNLRSNSGQVNSNLVKLCHGLLVADGCVMSQTFSFNLYVTNVVGVVATTAAKNDDIVKLWAFAKSKDKQTNTNWLSSAITEFGSTAKILILGLLIFAVIFVIVGGFVAVRHHKQGGTNGGGLKSYAMGPGPPMK